jgi:ADP-ribose pyrophosphatase
MTPRIIGRRIEYERPWIAVEAKEVRVEGADDSTYYSIRTADYAVVLAVTGDGRIPLVRQFRPAVEARSLELPSGLVEAGEPPEDTVRRELLEETGCRAASVVPIARFDVDTGRMQTVEHAFFAPEVEVVASAPSGEEADLEVIFATPDELRDAIRDGEFRMAAHVAVVGAAIIAELIQ